ncbi:MAG: hypothetical protein KC729_19410, partial [Candidatus Eisenbacteria bacterium]|nr:hypothetical protein [Candidatus Eisenbacteria bacterium]
TSGLVHADQQRAEERLAESRSKFRELRALLESAHRVLREHPTAETGDEPAAALTAYLKASVEDTAEALRLQRRELQRQ